MRVYLETTIPSYIIARPSADQTLLLRQRISRAWWETERSRHQLFISEVVFEEISKGEPEMALRRISLLEGIPQLLVTPPVKSLARQIANSGLLPAKALADAFHIALASVNQMDILLSWNFRHIANAAIQSRLRRIVESAGEQFPTICAPEQLFEI